MTIHMLKLGQAYDKPVTTLCRKTGTAVKDEPDTYVSGKERFRAVHPLNTMVGATCKDCRRFLHAKRTDNTNLRVL